MYVAKVIFCDRTNVPLRVTYDGSQNGMSPACEQMLNCLAVRSLDETINKDTDLHQTVPVAAII